MNEEVIGLLFALGAVFGWGIYALPLKYWHVTDINPIVLQFYFAVAIFCTSWLILLKYEFHFTYLGLIGATIWTNCSIFSFLAIKFAGLAIAQGIWSGCVIFVSFLWGAVYFHEPISNLPLVIVGLVLIFIGVIAISLCDTQLHLHLPPSLQFIYRLNWFIVEEYHEEELLPFAHPVEMESKGESGGDSSNDLAKGSEEVGKKVRSAKRSSESAPLIPNYNISTNRLKREHLKVTHEFILGVFLATTLGATSGCVFVPLQYLPDEFEGENRIVYVISFSIGVIAISTTYLILYLLVVNFYFKRDWKEEFGMKNMSVGMLSGVIWWIGNFSGTFTIIYLGMAIGFPLTQACIIVAGFCGIFILREITRYAAVLQFFVGSLVVIGGCCFLAIYGS